jgi:hypothetical protein
LSLPSALAARPLLICITYSGKEGMMSSMPPSVCNTFVTMTHVNQ